MIRLDRESARATAGGFCAGRCWVSLAVLCALAALPVVEAQGQTLDELAAARQAAADQYRQASELVEERADDLMYWSLLFDSWTAFRRLDRIVTEPAGDEASPNSDEAAARLRRDQAGWFAEWQQRMPDRPALELMRVLSLGAAERRIADLRELGQRFPHHSDTARQVVMALGQAGLQGEATAAAEGFLLANPEQPAAYGLLYRQFEAQGEAVKARDLLESWSRLDPADPRALELQLDQAVRDRLATEELLDLATRGSDRLRGENKVRWCSRLARSSYPTVRDAGLTCFAAVLPTLDANEASYDSAWVRYAEAMGRDGGPADVLAQVENASAQVRDRVLVTVGSSWLQGDRCGEGAALLARRVRPGDELGSRAHVFSACAGDPAVQDILLIGLASADENDVRRLLEAAQGEVPPERLEAVLLTRAETRGADTLRPHLDALYAAAGWREKRVALLERWLADDPRAGPDQARALADLYLADDRRDEAIAVLAGRAETDSGRGDQELHDALVALYLSSDRYAEAVALADHRLVGSENEALLGRLLHARIAWARGEEDAALAHYERFFDQAPAREWYRAEEYQALLLEVGDEARLRRFLERRWQVREQNSAGAPGNRDLWIASQFEEMGLVEASLTIYERHIASGEATGDLIRRVARQAEMLGEWGRALPMRRQMLERAPTEWHSWTELAKHFLDREMPAQAFEVLEGAFERLENPPANLWTMWADALLAEGAEGEVEEATLRQAIEVLLEASDRFDDNDYTRAVLNNRLVELYRRLGKRPAAQTIAAAKEPPSLPSAATGTAPPPVAAEEFAEIAGMSARQRLARADALYAGIGRSVDLAAARSLFESAAEDDPVAALRLATLLTLGAAGFDKDPQRASRLAQTHRRSVEALAAEGDAQAQAVVGLALLVGVGGVEDPVAARQWLEECAQQEPWAAYNLAWMTSVGKGVKKDPARSLRLYLDVARRGHAKAMWVVAWRQLYGGAGERNPQEGVAWLRRSAEAGQAEAMRELGWLLLSGEFLKADSAAGLGWLRKAARVDFAGAFHSLGYVHLKGIGVEKDPARAAAYFEQAVERGEVTATNYLGDMYRRGLGVAKDPQRAMALLADAVIGGDPWSVDNLHSLVVENRETLDRASLRQVVRRFLAAAEEGNTNAAAGLGFLAFNGAGSDLSSKDAAAWLRFAAEGGVTRAKRLYGDLFKRGWGVEKSPAQALRWWREGAAEGDHLSMYFIGWNLLYNEEFPRDEAAGLRWLRKAAEAGSMYAQNLLGRFHEHGEHGFPKDLVEARSWYEKAAENGLEEAIGWLAVHGER
ncbi:MAG: hypothetical protein AAF481_18790 [Acidobacteriota bacterium]